MEDLTVACVYTPGGGFTDEYVRRLQAAISANCAAPYRFVCLTNARLDRIETAPLVNKWRGWWGKVELFRKGLFDGPVRYFDLDTVIVSDVTDILMYPHEFTTGTNWKRPDTIASGFLAWDGREDLSYLVDEFDPATAHPRGDQAFIQAHLRRPRVGLDELFPGRWVSYKYHVRGKGIPSGASIIAFHGAPRPHQVGWRVE